VSAQETGSRGPDHVYHVLLRRGAGARITGTGGRASITGAETVVGLERAVTAKGSKGCAGVDGRPSGVLPMTNRFTMSRTGETGVLWLRFQAKKEICDYTSPV